MSLMIQVRENLDDVTEIRFNGAVHYEVFLSGSHNNSWVVSECGYSGRDAHGGFACQKDAVSDALHCLVADIDNEDWLEGLYLD